MMPRQYALPFATRRAMREDGFICAPCNAAAWAWLERMDAWAQGRLALWGAEGCGKSHLLQIWARRQGAPVLDGAALRFAAELPRALAIDDADLAGEVDLLHVLNAMSELRRPVLLAARAAPARWPVGLADLGSRLRAMSAVEILPADEALLGKLLARLLAERQLRIGEDMQAWLLLRLPRTQAAMHAAAAQIDRLTLHLGTGVTWPVARAVVAAAQGAANDEDFASVSPASGRLI